MMKISPAFAARCMMQKVEGADADMKARLNKVSGLLCLAILLAYPPALRLLSLAV